jgi:hypothetical protein
MIGNIQKRVGAGRNLAFMRVFLAVAAHVLPPIGPLKKLSTLVFEGRLLVEYHAGRPRAAENLFVRHARSRKPTFWAVSTYIANVVDLGQAKRLDELLQNPRLSPGAAVLLHAARRKNGKASGEGRPDIPPQLTQHERLAEDRLAFMKAETDYLAPGVLVSAALSAEACDREDLFGRAIALLLEQMDRIERSKAFSREHLADVVMAKLTIFDLDGARTFLAKPFIAGTARGKKLGAELEAIEKDVAAYRYVILQAHQDVLARARGVREPTDGLPVVLMPAAALRKNKIDYPGFRSDIRFVFGAIVNALEAHKIPYAVRSRLKAHGRLNLSTPSFSYHTISDNDLGLHIKETDRPSLFSFDRRGYAGWSEFSENALLQPQAENISPDEADTFFLREKQRIIGGNVSKYQQTSVSDPAELPERFIFVALQLVGDAVAQLGYISPFDMLDEVMRVAEAHRLAVVIKRHPFCVSPELSRHVERLVSEGKALEVHSSIHAVIPKAEAVCVVNSGVGAEALLHEKPVYVFGRSDYMSGCFVCREKGDFSRLFVPGRSRLSSGELRMFWYLLRNRYAVDLRDEERAAARIEAKVLDHLRALDADPAHVDAAQ